MFLLISTFIVLVGLAIFMRKWFTFWTRQGINGPNFLELLVGLGQPQHKYAENMAKKYGKIYGTIGISQRILTINDPDLIQEIIVKQIDTYPGHFGWYPGSMTQVNKMMVFLQGTEWKRIRSLTSPAFSSGKLNAMISKISDNCEELLTNLQKYENTGQVFDIRKFIEAFALDVVLSCTFGIKLDSLNKPDHPIIINAKKVFYGHINLSQITCIVAPTLAEFLKLNYIDKELLDFFTDLTNKIVLKRKLRDKQHTIQERPDMMQILMDSVGQAQLDNCNDDENGERQIYSSLTPEEMTAQAIMFLLVGFDTTMASILHVIYYLAKYPKCQQKVYEELKDIKEFSVENMTELKYLNAVINESLRLKPSILLVPRVSAKDTELAGIRIPAGTVINILPYVMHRDPDYWTDPLKFKPERFLEQNYNPRAYIPFGGGPRICIGQKFALNQTIICCANLILKLKFKLAPGFKLEYFNGGLVFDPKNLMVQIENRV